MREINYTKLLTSPKAYAKAVSFPYEAVVCEQNIDEMKRIFYRLFPLPSHSLECFL